MTTTYAGMHSGSAASRIVEMLELEPERYWTLDQLMADLVWRYGALSEDTVGRAFHRLAASGRVEAIRAPYENSWGTTKVERQRTLIRYFDHDE